MFLLCQVDLNQSAESIHNFIRGCDKVPGAWIEINGEVHVLYNIVYNDHVDMFMCM